MRLVCPNCEAKYEVPDDAIPDTGRDVQCASCGHGWYQMRPRAGAGAGMGAGGAVPEPIAVAMAAEVVEAEAPAVVEAAAAVDVVSTVVDTIADNTGAEIAVAENSVAEVQIAADAAVAIPDPDATIAPTPFPKPMPKPMPKTVVDVPVKPEPEAEPKPETVEPMPEPVEAEAAEVHEAPDAEQETDPDEAPVGTPQDAEPAAAPAGYAVDESVLAILREEAERESNARRAEATQPLEVQPDLGLVAAAVAAPPVADAVAGDDKPSARRDLLPDVEEINSTLRPSEAGDDDAPALDDMPPPGAERSGGFRSGFLWVMTFAMIGAGVYMAAPSLARMVPSLAGPLDSYVTLVNGMRLELDGLMRSATVALNGN